MKCRNLKCPYCKSDNTRTVIKKVHVGHSELKEILPQSDQNDYLLLQHICDGCGKFYYSKTRVDITYGEDSIERLLSKDEARYWGLI